MQTAETIVVLDPSLERRKAVTVPLATRAPRSWNGTVVALLDNTKHRADVMLDALEKYLAEQGVARVVRARKPSASLPMPNEIARRLLSAQLFITAVGD